MQYYNDPAGGTPSSIGTQMNTFYWHKKAIIEAKKEMYFTPLADVTNMPKHFGKEIKVYHYIPLLDDRNINDQGIDAAGVAISEDDYKISFDDLVYSFAVEADATDAAAAVNAVEAGVAVKSGSGPWLVTMSKGTLAEYATAAEAAAIVAELPLVTSLQMSGNLYGSSKDVGTITGRIPTLTETGGRVNRVGFTRLERSGTIQKLGIFTEFTQESFDFDSDEELYSHISRELVTGATQLSEAMLQMDLLAAAGVTIYAGAATANGEITGEGTVSVVDYDDLLRLNTTLNDNRTPKQTKIITGSRMIDTKTISAGRVMFVGSELESTLKKMVDPFSNQAFIPVHQYADAGTLLNGEIGTIDAFRIVIVPEMLNWSGQGAAVGTNPGYRASAGKYDIFPMLVVGDAAFTTIGFQTDGKTVKFKITTKMPGEKTADRTDPYGEMGFSSIKWYYGTLILRPERIAVIKTVAPQ